MGSSILTPDLCVIGGGPAGFAMATAAIGLGLSCVLVDRRLPLGRSQAADLAGDILFASRPGDSWPALRERVGHVVASRAPLHDAARLRALGVTVLEDTARFLDAVTATAGSASIRARRFVVATGAAQVLPAADADGSARLLTPETLWTLAEMPARLAVLGNTPAALETAQAFARLGAAAILIGPAPVFADPEFLDAIRAALHRGVVEMRWGDVVERISAAEDGVTLHLGPGRGAITATHVLAAGARHPRLADLGLDRAGVGLDGAAPAVRVDLRTGNPRVFVIGDALGGSGGAAAIPVQVGLVLRAAFFRQPVRYRPEQVPLVVRTHPGLARVGWTEAEARDRVNAVAIHRWPLAEGDRGAAERDGEGWIKVVATTRGQILGATILGPRAEELIAPWCLALTRNIPLDAVAAVPMPQPSHADASRRVALSFVASRLRRPWVRRTLGILRRLG